MVRRRGFVVAALVAGALLGSTGAAFAANGTVKIIHNNRNEQVQTSINAEESQILNYVSVTVTAGDVLQADVAANIAGQQLGFTSGTIKVTP